MKAIRWSGKTIIEKGLYDRIPIHCYHAAGLCDGPSISSSGLRTIWSQSPAHFYCGWSDNPNRIEQTETKAFILGRAAHHLLLGEDAFSTLFIARPDRFDSWRTKEAREWRDEQEENGRTVLIGEQIAQIRGMARSLAAHPLVRAGILNGQIEQSIVWRCKETGVWCKARPDSVPTDSGDVCDLKTTTSVRTDDLQRTIATYAYHMQGAFIAEGYHALTGSIASSFSLCFIESVPPYCCRIITLRDEDLARGEQLNLWAKKIFARCLKTGEWPGPGGADAEYLSLPAYEQGRTDHFLEQFEKEMAA